MSFSFLNNRIYVLFPFLLFIPMWANAKSAAEVKSELAVPTTVKISQSDERIYVATSAGSFVDLPKIVKENIAIAWATQEQDIEYVIVEAIDNERKKEILELSNKLGVRIRDFGNLELYREAVKWLGTRYKWAGKSSKGVDCSGLTNILIKTVYNKDIDRSSHIIADNLNEELDSDNLKPGDLVFFSTLRRKRISHVGVYLGDRLFIHASRKGVVVSSLDDNYYARTLQKAGRI